MGSDDELRKLIEDVEAKRRARIAAAIKRGGLPTASEMDELEQVLGHAHAIAEQLAFDVKGISESDDGSDLPFPISFEQIGTIAVIADTLDTRAKELERFSDQLRSRIFHLDCIRREQRPAEKVDA